MPAGDRQPLELLLDDAAWAAEPVRLATSLGHNVVFDAVKGERWTCTVCSRAVLRDLVSVFLSRATFPAGVPVAADLTTAAANDDGGSDDDTGATPVVLSSAEERAACRTWGQRRTKQFGKIGGNGRLPQTVIDGWVAAGRPGMGG